jgi:hypothetical protein
MNEKAKKEAEEMVLKFMRLQEGDNNWFHSGLAKKCASIAISQQIKTIKDKFYQNNIPDIRQTFDTPVTLYKDCLNPLIAELEQIKQEIEKL